jgi:flagellin-like hook-associated protein FlgL
MSSIPLPVGRVSNQMRSALVLGTLQADQLSLLKVQQQIATGKRLNQASDDPGATVAILRLNNQVAANTQYTSNLGFAAGFLAQADATLGQVNTLVTQAQSIANSMVGSTATADQRKAQAEVVNSMLSQLMDLANTQHQGQSVFGGQSGPALPFVSMLGGYKYVGSQQGQGILTPTGNSLEYTVDGNKVFGGKSAQVTGYQTITPALTNTTRLSDLAGALANGVETGPINVTVGATTLSVDLTAAANVGDVVSILNAALVGAGSDATIALSGGSLVVNGDSTQTLTIADAGSGSTAADLGIATTTLATATTTGAALSPKITATTTLASLNNGAGVDPAGLTISSGSSTATVTLAGPPAITTVGELLNAINAASPNVHATINAAGTAIDVQNPVSGAGLSIGENGGTTANDLGIRSFNPTTALTALNNGLGVTPISETIPGPTGTIVVTKTDGTQFNFKADGIKTPSQLIAAINAATGNTTVTAAMNATGNGITLTDTAGGSGNLTVAGGTDFASNGSVLGIFQTGTGGTLTGTDITLSTDDFRITRRDGTSFTVNITGATTVQDILTKINTADGNTGANAVTASLNTNGNGIRLSDASAGAGTLTVTGINASRAASQLGIDKAAATPGVITGDDVNPVSPNGLFASLVALRDALLGNNSQGIQRAAALLEQDGQRVITANGVIGAREQDIQTREAQVTNESTQLKKSLTLLADTDMTEAITKYQMLQTAYQAALQVAAKNQNLSLLDFLN